MLHACKKSPPACQKESGPSVALAWLQNNHREACLQPRNQDRFAPLSPQETQADLAVDVIVAAVAAADDVDVVVVVVVQWAFDTAGGREHWDWDASRAVASDGNLCWPAHVAWVRDVEYVSASGHARRMTNRDVDPKDSQKNRPRERRNH